MENAGGVTAGDRAAEQSNRVENRRQSGVSITGEWPTIGGYRAWPDRRGKQ